MITRVEARGFRCLKAVDQRLGRLEILVGPNGSGKSAFLNVLAFLATLNSDGLDAAIQEKTENFHDLVWGRQGNGFELAIEAEVPADRRRVPFKEWTEDSVRYEVEVRIDPERDTVLLAKERVTVRRSKFGRSEILVVDRSGTSLQLYSPESDSLRSPVHFPRDLSALHPVGSDREKFPAAAWLNELLAEGIQRVELESESFGNQARHIGAN